MKGTFVSKFKNPIKNSGHLFPFVSAFVLSLAIFLIGLSLLLYRGYQSIDDSALDTNISQEGSSIQSGENDETGKSANTEEGSIADSTTNTSGETGETANSSSSEESQTSEQDDQTTPTPDPTPTPEPEPEPVPDTITATVAFYSDNQSDTDAEDAIHQKTVNNILNSGANPIFHAGDLMEDGTQDSLDRFNSVTNTLRSSRSFYAALGNNDRKIGDSSTPSQLFLDNFSFPNNERWYSVNYGNLHMVVLDSAFASGSAAQLSWLTADLQSAASQDRITGVIFHHPTFSSTINSYLVNYGVDFVVAGHNHSYAHTTSNGIHYFTLSGQPSLGHMIGKIYHDKVIMTVYNNNNGVVANFEFNER